MGAAPQKKPRKIRDRLSAADKKQVLEAVTLGMSRRSAAALIRSTHVTINHEAKRDPEFAADLIAAEAECERYHLKEWRNAGSGWVAHAAFLERKFRKKWGRYAPRQDKNVAPEEPRRVIRQRPIPAAPPTVQTVSPHSSVPAVTAIPDADTRVA